MPRQEDTPQFPEHPLAEDRALAEEQPEEQPGEPADEPRTDASPPGHGAAKKSAFQRSAGEVERRASARDGAATAKPLLARILQVVLAIVFPLVVLAAAVRAVTSSLFLWAEYHRPGFPADAYGFSGEDRMTYGSYVVDYVLNLAPARYLGDLVMADGTRLFQAGEVSHMSDVKAVLSTGFATAGLLALGAALCCVYLSRRYRAGIRRGLFAGSVATIALMLILTVAAMLGWEQFFTDVHRIFFSDGTWTFYLDDTLIRLFPEQFWTDAAGVIAFLVVLASLLTLLCTWPTGRRRARSRTAREASLYRIDSSSD